MQHEKARISDIVKKCVQEKEEILAELKSWDEEISWKKYAVTRFQKGHDMSFVVSPTTCKKSIYNSLEMMPLKLYQTLDI